MIIQASNGCLLTQSKEVSIKQRRFEKSMLVTTMAEAALWKEIPESEKERYIAEGNLFEPEQVNYDYLNKVNSLLKAISDKINNASLTDNEALDMQQYFPTWESKIGTYAYAGERFNYNGKLIAVVTPHTLSSDITPEQQPMTLEEPVLMSASEKATQSFSEVSDIADSISSVEEHEPTPVYFRIVVHVEEPADTAEEVTTTDNLEHPQPDEEHTPLELEVSEEIQENEIYNNNENNNI